jgi:hypothetical protein
MVMVMASVMAAPDIIAFDLNVVTHFWPYLSISMVTKEVEVKKSI